MKHLLLFASLTLLAGCAASSDITGLLNIGAQLVGQQQQQRDDGYDRYRYRHHRRHWDNRRYWR